MDDEGLKRLGELLREGVPVEVDPAHDDAERDRFVSAVARGGGAARVPARRSATRWIGALAAAAALAIGVAALWPASRLAYTVEGAPVTEAGYVAAQGGQEARMRFSDGSSVDLSAGASLRVTEVTSIGARMLLEHGQAALRITPREGARWTVEAGPFSVQVKGTAFDIVWTSSEQMLRIDLREGAVVVTGPLAPDGLPLRAGQRLVARLREGDMQIASLETAALAPAAVGADSAAGVEGAAAGAAPDEAPREDAAPQAQQEAPQAKGAPTAEAAAGLPSWSRRVAEGDFKSVLAEAEARGIDAVLKRGSLDDVVALGDAARYAKRGDIAQQALTATRERFAGSGPGKAAAFLLGRMSDGRGSAATAITWYDTYLRESPGGPFAAEALGRKMLAVERTAGRDAARPIAEQYLKRYPRGAHAPLAEDLINR